MNLHNMKSLQLTSIEVALIQFVVLVHVSVLAIALTVMCIQVGWVGNDYQFVEKNTFVDKVW